MRLRWAKSISTFFRSFCEAPGLDALDVGGEFETQQAVKRMKLATARGSRPRGGGQ